MCECLTIHHIIDLELQQLVKEKGNMFYVLLCAGKGKFFYVHHFYLFVLLSSDIIIELRYDSNDIFKCYCIRIY
jgi:hypothetical protein